MSKKRNKRKTRRIEAKNDVLELTFDAESCEIQASSQEGGPPKVDITAYTGGMLRLPNFRYPVIIQASGTKLHGDSKTQPLLRDHKSDRPLGQGEAVIGATDLRVSNGVLSIPSSDRDEVVKASSDGFQWQASVGGSVPQRRKNVHTYGAGKRVTVNGREFEGPVHVVRAFLWKETSLTALGADEERATAQVAASNRDEQMNEFEQWLEACGIAANDLTDDQESNLHAAFEAQQATPPVTPPADAVHASSIDMEQLAGSVRSTLVEETRQERQRLTRLDRIFANNQDVDLPSEDLENLRAQAESGEMTEEGVQLALLRASRNGSTNNTLGGRTQDIELVLECAISRSAGLDDDEIAASMQVAPSTIERVMNESLQARYRDCGIHHIIHAVCASVGHQIVGKITDEDIHCALRYSRDDSLPVYASTGTGFSTISLPGILSRLANKAMLRSYSEADNGGVVTRVFSETQTNDFKKFNRYRLTEAGIVEEVPASGEIKHGELIEEEYENQVKQHGKLLTLSRVMMRNDDLNAFLQIPRLMGRAARHGLEQKGITTLVNAPTNSGAGTNEFFHGAARGNDQPNYFEGGDSALSMTSLGKAYQYFLDQTDKDGKPIMIDPAILLVCTDDFVLARKLYNDTEYRFIGSGDRTETINNQWQGMFRPEKSSYMKRLGTTPSSTQWYLLSQPTIDVSGAQVAYLDGQRTPTIRQGEMDLKVLGVVYRVVFDFGVALQDPRAIVKSKGAA